MSRGVDERVIGVITGARVAITAPGRLFGPHARCSCSPEAPQPIEEPNCAL